MFTWEPPLKMYLLLYIPLLCLAYSVKIYISASVSPEFQSPPGLGLSSSLLQRQGGNFIFFFTWSLREGASRVQDTLLATAVFNYETQFMANFNCPSSTCLPLPRLPLSLSNFSIMLMFPRVPVKCSGAVNRERGLWHLLTVVVTIVSLCLGMQASLLCLYCIHLSSCTRSWDWEGFLMKIILLYISC